MLVFADKTQLPYFSRIRVLTNHAYFLRPQKYPGTSEEQRDCIPYSRTVGGICHYDRTVRSSARSEAMCRYDQTE